MFIVMLAKYLLYQTLGSVCDWLWMLLFVKFLCQWSSCMQIHFEVMARHKYNPISLMKMYNSAWEFN